MLNLILGFDTKSAAALSKCNNNNNKVVFYWLVEIELGTSGFTKSAHADFSGINVFNQ
jgi:hypothetical protein